MKPIRFSLCTSFRVILVMALCLAGYFSTPAMAQVPAKRAGRSSEQVAELQKTQAELLAEWDKGEVASLSSKDLVTIISSINDKGRFAVPQSGTKVNLDSLAVEIRTDLNDAIAGLIRAYCSDLQTTAVILYMKERNEVTDQTSLAYIRKQLALKSPFSSDDIKALTDDDVLRLYCGDDIQSHWQGIQTKASSLQIWKTSEALTAKTIHDFGRDYSALFPGIDTYPHIFIPKMVQLKDEVNNNAILVADVKLLIRFDDTLHTKPVIYFIRLWFCTADRKWHPLQLVRSATGGNSITKSQIVF